MELPKYIKYDLCGYRGYGIVTLPLVIEKREDRYVGHYSHDGAEISLITEWGETESEVYEKMEKTLELEFHWSHLITH